MNKITEQDIAQIEEKVVDYLTANLKESGTENLVKQIIKISAKVTSKMIWEYHQLIYDQSSCRE